MFKFIDRKIEKYMLKRLHKRRKKIVNEAIAAFRKKHANCSQEVLDVLVVLIEKEANRIYPMIDKSILHAGIKRARYVFWVTTISSIIIVGVMGAFTSGAALPFIIPVCSAVVAWLVALGTTPVLYNQRVQGAMASVISSLEEFLEKNPELEVSKLLSNPAELNEIKPLLIEINTKLDSISAQLTSLQQELAAARQNNNNNAIQMVEDKTANIVTAVQNDIPDTSKLLQFASLWQAIPNPDPAHEKEDLEVNINLFCK
jgi:hypothetical protein